MRHLGASVLQDTMRENHRWANPYPLVVSLVLYPTH